jgi:hypothetical protein
LFEGRSAIKSNAWNAADGEIHSQHIAGFAGRKVARRTVNRID